MSSFKLSIRDFCWATIVAALLLMLVRERHEAKRASVESQLAAERNARKAARLSKSINSFDRYTVDPKSIRSPDHVSK